ncbi:MAG: SDR family oxidoreductase [Myxococcales bacterium]|nr:SDR family oxidoreductase [Myxococcales bacterium]
MTDRPPFTDRFRLTGKGAVVTGGSRGIGRAIALGLAGAGADVMIASRDGARCDEVAAEARQLGVRSLGVPCDVAKEEDLVRLFERAATELPGVNVLVHCAGLSATSYASDVNIHELQRMMDVHYLAGVRAAQLAYPHLKPEGGAVLFVGSVWGLGGATGSLAYGAAKAALTHAVKVLALEWARDGIRVNGLAPGFVDTDMTRSVPDGAKQKLLGRVPLRRWAEPEEMAGPAVFLCSDAASYVTGHVLVADGGERAR